MGSVSEHKTASHFLSFSLVSCPSRFSQTKAAKTYHVFLFVHDSGTNLGMCIFVTGSRLNSNKCVFSFIYNHYCLFSFLFSFFLVCLFVCCCCVVVVVVVVVLGIHFFVCFLFCFLFVIVFVFFVFCFVLSLSI